MKIKFIIIDDEPLAHTVIRNYCKDLSFMQNEGNCYNAVEAINLLKSKKIDLIFLDINMPKLKGFDFLRTLDFPPKVIVSSAYEEFAIEAFELNVCDYLLKPFSYERFLKAVYKAIDTPETSTTDDKENSSIFIKTDKKFEQISLASLQYIEACGSYTILYTEEKKIISKEKISDLEEILTNEFIRIHRSYIVSIKKIGEIHANSIRIGEREIPVGKVYKANVNKLIRNK